MRSKEQKKKRKSPARRQGESAPGFGLFVMAGDLSRTPASERGGGDFRLKQKNSRAGHSGV